MFAQACHDGARGGGIEPGEWETRHFPHRLRDTQE